jgi:hypothetical protein
MIQPDIPFPDIPDIDRPWPDDEPEEDVIQVIFSDSSISFCVDENGGV